jgi:hypothetical protein
MDTRDLEIGDIFTELLEFEDLRRIVREIYFFVRYFRVLCFSTPIFARSQYARVLASIAHAHSRR